MTTDTPDIATADKRKKILIATTMLFILVALGYSLYYMLVLVKEEETDNAYVGGNLVTLSSQITGNVQEIRADETQMVKANAELIKLDPIDAKVTLNQAEARLGATVLQLRERYASIAQYEAVVKQRKVSLQKTEDDFARRAPLAADHTLSAEDVSHAKQAVDDAQAALDVAAKQLTTAQSAVGSIPLTQHPSILAAKQDFIQAWLVTRRNSVLAPVSGYIAKRSVQVGSHVTPGVPMLSIVPLDQLWVDANFKESELQNIRIGQPASIEADIYGSKMKFHGRVVGLSAGTGSAFALLPAQNASGNWVKVVQRLPVRIALDPKELAEHPLRIGLSTVVTVDTHQRDGSVLGMPMPTTPVYATQAFNQPTQEAEAIANKIIEKNTKN